MIMVQRDTNTLREYVNTMPTEEAKEMMQKMVDSGLWVPDPADDPLGLTVRSSGG